MTGEAEIELDAAIIKEAIHLARRLTTPPRRQSRIMGANTVWFSSHCSSLGELRAAAQAASSTKGVVGSTGRNAPTTPSKSDTNASARYRPRHTADKGDGTARGGAMGGGVSGMGRLCLRLLG